MKFEAIKDIDWKKQDGLVPAVIQDFYTGNVLMLGYMNKAALKQTLEEEKLTFYSRTKERLWTKGETSGNFLKLKELKLDCDGDTLLAKVIPIGPVCHKGPDTCWDETNMERYGFLRALERVIIGRKKEPQEGSYTSKLFKKGINRIAKKFGEEAVELVIEAKDNNDDLYVAEAADMLYHFTVMCAAKDIPMDDILKELRRRHK